ncbi:MAG TPA: hypothetical protein GX506_12020 [Firmicutes bacterium]|nr:hypothetical protein [Bacillota bacterium]
MTTETDRIRIELGSLGIIERAVSAVLDLYLMALREQEFAIESKVEEKAMQTRLSWGSSKALCL